MQSSLKLYVALLAKILVTSYREAKNEPLDSRENFKKLISGFIPVPNKHLWISDLDDCLPNLDESERSELSRLEKVVSSKGSDGEKDPISKLLKLISLDPYFAKLVSPEVASACAQDIESNMKGKDGEDSVLCLNSLSFPIAISLASRNKTVYCGMYKDRFARVIIGLFSALLYTVKSEKKGRLRLVADDDVDSVRLKTKNLVYAEKFSEDEPDIPGYSRRCENNYFLLDRRILWESSLKAQDFRSTVSGRDLVSVITLPGTKLPKSNVIAQGCLVITSEKQRELTHPRIRMAVVESPADKTLDIASWDFATAIVQTNETYVDVSPRALYSANSLDPQRYLADADLEISRLEEFSSSNLEFIANIVRAQNITKAESEASEDFLYMAKEVAIGDIDEFGFVRAPEKTILVSRNGEKRATQASLNDGDIVLAIKGSVGKVGLIRKPKDEKWVANQSLLIIRSRPSYSQDYPNYYLFRFLSSDFVRKYFDSRAIGAYIPSISMTDVRRLDVPLVPEAFLAEQKNKLAESEETLATINKLKEKIIKLKLNIHDFLEE